MTALFYRNLSPYADLPGIFSRLPERKRELLGRLRRRTDFIRSLTAYGLLEDALTQSVDNPPALSALAWSPTGRPCLPERPGLFFSLTHSGDIAVCALGGTPVGVDVEPTSAAPTDYPALAGVMGFAPCASPGGFLRLWVLWESYLKFTGQAAPPCDLQAVQEGNTLILVNRDGPLPARFFLHTAPKGSLIAVCLPPTETTAPPVRYLPSSPERCCWRIEKGVS